LWFGDFERAFAVAHQSEPLARLDHDVDPGPHRLRKRRGSAAGRRNGGQRQEQWLRATRAYAGEEHGQRIDLATTWSLPAFVGPGKVPPDFVLVRGGPPRKTVNAGGASRDHLSTQAHFSWMGRDLGSKQETNARPTPAPLVTNRFRTSSRDGLRSIRSVHHLSGESTREHQAGPPPRSP
jgi:hypothetical protein